MVLATVKTMTYTDMSEAVKRLFSVDINNPVAGTLYNVEEITVKNETEGCYYLNNFGQSRGSIRGTFRGGYRGGRGYRRGSWSQGRGTTSYTGCYKCQGLDHFMRNCPKLKGENSQYFSVSDDRGSKDKSVDHSEITYITLLADASSEYVVKDYPDVASLVHETLACAVIDSGCTRTVVVTSCIECYKETLNENQLKMMKINRCNVPFRFGDGEVIYSQTVIDIPGRVGNCNVLISANVVDIGVTIASE